MLESTEPVDRVAGIDGIDAMIAPVRTTMKTAMPTFDQVYEAHVAFVWRVLRAMGLADAQLEDAVQDVFVVVHRRLGEFEGRAAITTWLFAIARRVASGYRRKTTTERARHEALSDELVGGADTFAAMSRAQAAATVQRILDGMDEARRLVFVLVELEQQSVPEVATMLEINLNTAYSRLRLARAEFEAAATKAMKTTKVTP
ncbi:MAG: RNA polymerase sigma factor [Proteobacteria bacterium]|nr:RNA polymerase sigma factor [Pseudomonadota bacterium]